VQGVHQPDALQLGYAALAAALDFFSSFLFRFLFFFLF
jgi:hypothetical protein